MDSRIKTLFSSEAKKLIWLFILSIAMVYITSVISYNSGVMGDYNDLINNHNTLSDLSLYGFYPTFDMSNMLWLFLLVFFQFSTNTNLWHSLPYSKKELHYSKIITGTLFITLIFLYYSAMVLSIYNDNKFIYDEISMMTDGSLLFPTGRHIFMHIVLVYLIYLFEYYLLVFLQYISNDRTIGIIFGIAVLTIPTIISDYFIDMGKHPSIYRYLLIYTNDYSHFNLSYIYNSEYFNIHMGNVAYFQTPTYIYYIVLLAAVLFISSKINNSEENGILYKRIYAYGFILSVALTLSYILTNIIFYSEMQTFMFFVFTIIFVVVTAIWLKKKGVRL